MGYIGYLKESFNDYKNNLFNSIVYGLVLSGLISLPYLSYMFLIISMSFNMSIIYSFSLTSIEELLSSFLRSVVYSAIIFVILSILSYYLYTKFLGKFYMALKKIDKYNEKSFIWLLVINIPQISIFLLIYFAIYRMIYIIYLFFSGDLQLFLYAVQNDFLGELNFYYKVSLVLLGFYLILWIVFTYTYYSKLIYKEENYNVLKSLILFGYRLVTLLILVAVPAIPIFVVNNVIFLLLYSIIYGFYVSIFAIPMVEIITINKIKDM